jgi:predicted Rossmann fold nucleotide-binding protein DprA/Smf involved in DNA uptake
MKLAIVGSRDITDFDLSPYVDDSVLCIVSGGAKGIDTIAAEFAESKGLELIEYLPDYKSFGRSAPIIRNKLIIENADKVLAIWDGKSKGTKNSIDTAKKLNKPLQIVYI